MQKQNESIEKLYDWMLTNTNIVIIKDNNKEKVRRKNE